MVARICSFIWCPTLIVTSAPTDVPLLIWTAAAGQNVLAATSLGLGRAFSIPNQIYKQRSN